MQPYQKPTNRILFNTLGEGVCCLPLTEADGCADGSYLYK